MNPQDDLEIMTGDPEKVLSWVKKMLDRCQNETRLAELAAFGGIQDGQTVDEVVKAFGLHRANAQYQYAMTEAALRHFKYTDSVDWTAYRLQFHVCLANCANAGAIVELARTASLKTPTADLIG